MVRRRETPFDKVWKFRGVIAVVSVPILLVVAILLLMPRGHTNAFDGHDHHHHLPAHGKAKPTETMPTDRFSIVFDAGSTGSRVHIFKFKDVNGQAELDSDTFEQLKPGLSSYASDPAKGAKSIMPLLQKAVDTVPQSLQRSTQVQVRATAGLRLLPGDQAEQLLVEVRKLLKTYPFEFDDSSVSIMDGADEGAFAWTTLNYLLGNLGGAVDHSVAAIDLGGGSVQLAHAVEPATAGHAPDGYIHEIKGGRKKYSVYVHSYLGFGIMAARAAILSSHDHGHPCLPKGFSGEYKYGGKTYAAVADAGGADVAACSSAIDTALQKDKDCAMEHECSFNGAWGGGGGGGARTFYVSSYFFDRAVESGVIADEAAISAETTPGAFLAAAHKACPTDAASVTTEHPLVGADHAPYFCLDLLYCHTLLTQGFKLEGKQSFTLVKRIKYNGEEVEAAWPLGAAINTLS